MTFGNAGNGEETDVPTRSESLVQMSGLGKVFYTDEVETFLRLAVGVTTATS